MRIISGKYKGRLIKMPAGIRPTQNKVRKALFDILGDIQGLSFLELFSGSGAVGFEAVSRGVTDLTLVEYNPSCLMAIRKNIESLEPKACDVYPKEAGDAIEAFRKNKRKFDIIFLDPPYYRPEGHGLASFGQSHSQSHKEMSKKILQMLGAYDILAPNGFVVVQHFKKEQLPKESGKLTLIKEARYGDT
ncbi:MAG: RsmD family RNA methyltransferase, partial [Candidatus Omnitrophota bacterium]|nr:RsmD family RNA methyltransferase [Candidatus Omnitrophota bacterium]